MIFAALPHTPEDLRERDARESGRQRALGRDNEQRRRQQQQRVHRVDAEARPPKDEAREEEGRDVALAQVRVGGLEGARATEGANGDHACGGRRKGRRVMMGDKIGANTISKRKRDEQSCRFKC